MKYATTTAFFWALLAGQSLAFSPASIQKSSLRDNEQGKPLPYATLQDTDCEIALDETVVNEPDIGSVSFPGLQEFTKILQDGVNYPTGSLPKDLSTSAFEILFHWGKQETVEGAIMVDQLIGRFEQEDHRLLNNRHYAVAVEAWAKSGHPNAAGRAEKALNRMEQIAERNPFAAPNRQDYSKVVHAYAEQGKASKAHAILRRMEASRNLAPVSGDYSVVLAAFAREGNARKAEEILKTIVDLCNNGAKEYAPGLTHYHMVLDSWARSNEPGAGERARQILSALHEMADQGDLNLQPYQRTYTSVMNNIVRSHDKDRVEQAEELLKLAEERGIVPDAYLLTSIMQVYANEGAVERTEEILRRLEEHGIANSAAYNTVIKAWKESAAPDAPERAERCLERMAALGLADTISYTTVIAVYASRGDSASAEKGESLLQEMRELFQAGNERVKPNIHAVNAVLNSWVQSGDVVRAEMILNEMERMSEAGESDICPNVVSYSTVINGWWKSTNRDGPARAERVFRRMVDAYKAGNHAARPNLVSYVNLINAITRSGDDNAAQRAEEILLEMFKQYENGDSNVKPNARVIGLVMDCWRSSGKRDAGDKVEALLNWMLDIYGKTKDKDFQPNEFICSLAISAWSRCRSFGKAAHVRGILQKMKSLHKDGTISAPPNTHCYTAVINSCAYCVDDEFEKRQALEIALATYKELERTPAHGTPNHVTYATMIAALTNLLPPSESRSAAVASVFKRCCERGYVDGLVIKRLQGALTKEELCLLCPESLVMTNGKISAVTIPNEWRQQLRQE